MKTAKKTRAGMKHTAPGVEGRSAYNRERQKKKKKARLKPIRKEGKKRGRGGEQWNASGRKTRAGSKARSGLEFVFKKKKGSSWNNKGT